MNFEDLELSNWRDLPASPMTPFSFVDRPAFRQAPFWCLVQCGLLFAFLGALYRLTPRDPRAVAAILSASVLAFAAVLARYLHLARFAGYSYRLTDEMVEIGNGRLTREVRCVPWSYVQSVSSRVSVSQCRFGTGDLVLRISPEVGEIKAGASLSLGCGALSRRRTRGEGVVLRDVLHPEEKRRLMMCWVASRATAGAL